MTLKLLSIKLALEGVLLLDKSIPLPAVFVPLVGVVFLIGDTPLFLVAEADYYFVIGVAAPAAYAFVTIYAASVGVRTVFVKYDLTISTS